MPLARSHFHVDDSVNQFRDFDDDLVEKKPKKPASRAKRICKRILKYAFSHIGLCILLVAYCGGGAAMFRLTDGGPEKELKEQSRIYAILLQEQKENLSLWLKSLTTHPDCCKWYNAKSIRLQNEIKHRLNSWHKNITFGIRKYQYRGKSDENGEFQLGWTLASAILFTVSIVTVIGYGQITPTTEIGRLMVIFYALVGVPLMLMFLANIGEILATGIRYLYGRGCCYFCWMQRKRTRLYYRNPGFELIRAQAESSLVPGTVDINSMDQDAEPIVKKEDEDIHRIQIPIALTCALLISYVFIGTLLFRYWEGWSLITSAYFCFVSLATIGFGDFVPGWNSLETTGGKLRMAFSSLYIVFGLAFLSMGFNLMVDQLVFHFEKAGKKLGLVVENPMGESGLKSNLQNKVKRQIAKL